MLLLFWGKDNLLLVKVVAMVLVVVPVDEVERVMVAVDTVVVVVVDALVTGSMVDSLVVVVETMVVVVVVRLDGVLKGVEEVKRVLSDVVVVVVVFVATTVEVVALVVVVEVAVAVAGSFLFMKTLAAVSEEMLLLLN